MGQGTPDASLLVHSPQSHRLLAAGTRLLFPLLCSSHPFPSKSWLLPSGAAFLYLHGLPALPASHFITSSAGPSRGQGLQPAVACAIHANPCLLMAACSPHLPFPRALSHHEAPLSTSLHRGTWPQSGCQDPWVELLCLGPYRKWPPTPHPSPSRNPAKRIRAVQT